MKSYGFTGCYNILIMQLLGKDLESYLNQFKKFSLKTVCILGKQMLNILESIHEKHILHRDIKPENFVMGLNHNSNKVYLIDWRDELESLGYIFVYFLKGKLPWQNIIAKNKEEKYKKILEKKMEISSEELCKDLPKEFEMFLEYNKNIKYEEKPDYKYLHNLIDKIMDENNIKNDYIYDWTLDEEKNKYETTNDNSINKGKENDNYYHIKTNKKIYYNQFEEPEINCSSVCSIFWFY